MAETLPIRLTVNGSDKAEEFKASELSSGDVVEVIDIMTALQRVEEAAVKAYQQMLSGQQKAVWRNWLARTVRGVVPPSMRNLARAAAAKVGLGNNPLVPNR